MKNKILLLTGALLTTNVADANIFRNFLDNTKATNNNLGDSFVVTKKFLPNSKLYYYKMSSEIQVPPEPTRVPPTAPPMIIEERPVLHHPVVIDDAPQISSKISDNDKHDEVGNKVEKVETNHVYGKDSPLRDDAVAEAWRVADEAEARLQRHREYMEKLRIIRLEKAAAKDIDGAKNSD